VVDSLAAITMAGCLLGSILRRDSDVIGLVSLGGFWDRLLAYKGSHEPWVVIAGSLGMAFFACAGTGVIARLGLRMHF
jgi:hypothetical protein